MLGAFQGSEKQGMIWLEHYKKYNWIGSHLSIKKLKFQNSEMEIFHEKLRQWYTPSPLLSLYFCYTLILGLFTVG